MKIIKLLFYTKYRVAEYSDGKCRIQFKNWFTFYIWDSMLSDSSTEWAKKRVIELRKEQESKIIAIHD